MPYVGEQKKEYQRAWLAKRRANYFKNKCCVNCGSREKLELDHIDPTKKISHNVWSWTEERRLNEISKCQILCLDCHKEKSANEKALGSKNGRSKLAEKEVIRIREEWDSGLWKSHSAIAGEYSLDRKTIGDILNRKTWVHI